jgi:hypothetical protein
MSIRIKEVAALPPALHYTAVRTVKNTKWWEMKNVHDGSILIQIPCTIL